LWPETVVEALRSLRSSRNVTFYKKDLQRRIKSGKRKLEPLIGGEGRKKGKIQFFAGRNDSTSQYLVAIIDKDY
jgi:hypothetical protein